MFIFEWFKNRRKYAVFEAAMAKGDTPAFNSDEIDMLGGYCITSWIHQLRLSLLLMSREAGSARSKLQKKSGKPAHWHKKAFAQKIHDILTQGLPEKPTSTSDGRFVTVLAFAIYLAEPNSGTEARGRDSAEEEKRTIAANLAAEVLKSSKPMKRKRL